MYVDAYLDRIRLERPARADLAALRAVHRAHLLAIPYEDLDVQLGHTVTTNRAEIFEKIVTRGRGGWCYEMNGLLGWALQELGFRVTRSAGAVNRDKAGDTAIGNHLVLKVELEEGLYLADAGFGDGPIDPIRIVPGEFTSHGFGFALTQLDDGWWRLQNHPAGGAATFDFNLAAADEWALAEKCRVLQTSAESSFVQNLVVQQHTGTGFTTLRGRLLKHTTVRGTTVQLLHSGAELVSVLKREFGLHVPEALSLWPRVVARHEQLFETERDSTVRSPAAATQAVPAAPPA